jgi:hypothetical protein
MPDDLRSEPAQREGVVMGLELIIQIIAGLVGGNAAGAGLRTSASGLRGNRSPGRSAVASAGCAPGGDAGASADAAAGRDIGSIIQSAAGGGISGALLKAIAGYSKKSMAK